jgi:ABC-2 type transport system permease protein
VGGREPEGLALLTAATVTTVEHWELGAPSAGGHSIARDLAKLPAFLRRDFLTAWSYRMSFFTDIVSLLLQALMFYFVGKMVDETVLPEYGGQQTTYIEYVAVGIALSAVVSLGLNRVAAAIRYEQLMGTLESLLLTPTRLGVIQLGSAFYYVAYTPIRTGVFLLIVAVFFDLSFASSGILPAATILVFFLPFVWGLGIATAGGLLTFRRGAGGLGFGATALTITSGAYFPLSLFPGWIQTVAEANPLAIAVEALRDSLLGGAGWSEVGPALAVIVPASFCSIAFGVTVFRLALKRERRKGTLGLY